MLTNYQTDTQNLLQNPGAPTSLYPLANITRWINIARGQLAGEGECIRSHGTLTTVAGQQAYNFSSLDFGASATTGIGGAIHVSSVRYTVGTGYKWLTPRNWEWFSLYVMNTPVPQQGPPQQWAQYRQGAAAVSGGSSASGDFYLDPVPDDAYALSCNCICYPITLVDDSTVEAIPYLWTDAVPFFAAYYAYLSSQTAARQADADRMFQHYSTFVERARKAANPSVLRWQYAQAQDPAQLNKLGLPKQAAGGG